MISNPTAKILVIDDFHPVFLETLEAAKISTVYSPDFKLSEDKHLLKEYELIAVRSKIEFSSALLSELPQLRCIARGGAGMDNIDESFARSNGITLLNAPEGNRDAVAEHCLGLLLSMSKNIHKSSSEVEAFQWEREANRGWELAGKTVGIIGFGNTGSRFAKKLSGLDCDVIAYDKYADVSSDYALASDLTSLLKKADVISFHIPLNSETRMFLNADLISDMKDEVVLINTSRGGICKLEDIWNGINSGKVKSFAADVLENENLANLEKHESELLRLMLSSNQVIITPHIAGWSYESYKKIAEVLANKIIEYTTKPKNN